MDGGMKLKRWYCYSTLLRGNSIYLNSVVVRVVYRQSLGGGRREQFFIRSYQRQRWQVQSLALGACLQRGGELYGVVASQGVLFREVGRGCKECTCDSTMRNSPFNSLRNVASAAAASGGDTTLPLRFRAMAVTVPTPEIRATRVRLPVDGAMRLVTQAVPISAA